MLRRLLLAWTIDPTVIAGLAVLCLVYWYYRPRDNARGDRLFALMIVLTLLALESPLDFVADRYLFSMHMLQHLVLILGVAPLLVLTAPRALVDALRRWMPGWLQRTATQPAVVFLVFTVDVWGWHLPVLYEATLHSEWIHVLEHLGFVAAACLFWWVALSPHGERLPVLARMAYVFLGAITNTILGVVITFAPAVLYPSYARALDSPGLGRALQLNFGVTAAADQAFGGLLMWVPGGFVYLIILVAIFISWSARSQPAEPDLAAEGAAA